MESTRYSFSYGYVRSDWLWVDIDECYEAAVKHRKDYGYGSKDKEIRIWRKKIEEVIGL